MKSPKIPWIKTPETAGCSEVPRMVDKSEFNEVNEESEVEN